MTIPGIGPAMASAIVAPRRRRRSSAGRTSPLGSGSPLGRSPPGQVEAWPDHQDGGTRPVRLARAASEPAPSARFAPLAAAPRPKLDQPLDIADALRRDPAVLRQAAADGVAALAPLAHQKVARSEHDPAGLLLLALHRTYRIVGRWAASQIASASAASFFCPSRTA